LGVFVHLADQRPDVPVRKLEHTIAEQAFVFRKRRERRHSGGMLPCRSWQALVAPSSSPRSPFWPLAAWWVSRNRGRPSQHQRARRALRILRRPSFVPASTTSVSTPSSATRTARSSPTSRPPILQ